MVTVADVRRLAATLPRSYEVLVGGRIKFRVGSIVYISFSRDESVMGFAFPKDQRDWLVGGSPDTFMLPERGDLRYHWVLVRLAAIDEKEMRELVLDAGAWSYRKAWRPLTRSRDWSDAILAREKLVDPRGFEPLTS